MALFKGLGTKKTLLKLGSLAVVVGIRQLLMSRTMAAVKGSIEKGSSDTGVASMGRFDGFDMSDDGMGYMGEDEQVVEIPEGNSPVPEPQGMQKVSPRQMMEAKRALALKARSERVLQQFPRPDILPPYPVPGEIPQAPSVIPQQYEGSQPVPQYVTQAAAAERKQKKQQMMERRKQQMMERRKQQMIDGGAQPSGAVGMPIPVENMPPPRPRPYGGKGQKYGAPMPGKNTYKPPMPREYKGPKPKSPLMAGLGVPETPGSVEYAQWYYYTYLPWLQAQKQQYSAYYQQQCSANGGYWDGQNCRQGYIPSLGYSDCTAAGGQWMPIPGVGFGCYRQAYASGYNPIYYGGAEPRIPSEYDYDFSSCAARGGQITGVAQQYGLPNRRICVPPEWYQWHSQQQQNCNNQGGTWNPAVPGVSAGSCIKRY